MTRLPLSSHLLLAGLALAILGLAACAAEAQILDAGNSILPEIEVRGRGWNQLREPVEILEFLGALVESTAMIAALAYHPVILTSRRTRLDFDAPRDLFIYGLIGMVVGFLIMHHGYLIGFVLFGLGGLLRFKSDDGAADTMRLILVTLIGLCVGLDLPVVALISTVSAWAVIYAFGSPVNFALEVQFSKKIATTDAMIALRDALAQRGFKTLSMSKSKYKPVANFVVCGPRSMRRSALEREMGQLMDTGETDISDWHID
ncbi:hypothetical protein [Primorskyibacter sp. 2E233]|uniref:hypothetical protein n=1 Tax=Primorskyibacter sp. 2E233 TaxID=3413431 RepID=UPI003BF0CABE